MFEDLGKSKLWPSATVKTNLCAVRPFDDGKKRGVIGDNGELEEFLGSALSEMEYANFLKDSKQTIGVVPKKPVQLAPTVNTTRAGGKTPEELCVILLKALKTDNKALWMQCMDVGTDVEDDELSARRFTQYRQCLDQQGVTNWGTVTFSRMTHLAEGVVDPDKIRSRVGLEFTYKNGEFVGGLFFWSFIKAGGKWFVRSGAGDCSLNRSAH